MKCFMRCEPPEDDSERFWLAILPELTIYGHEINAWTRKNYPEDWSLVRQTQARGILWGCWHSQVTPDGEIGSQDPGICVNLQTLLDHPGVTTPDVQAWEWFSRFAEDGWPDLKDTFGLTSRRPVMSILVPPQGQESADGLFRAIEEGTLRETWNSLEGDKE